ncbi:uncharacterized protein LOC120104630 [Phoenix dactylifera]|uniref:Uncharacterized protein LOC120104630 n=1 Tax=Phoenix dactylifera TaxID=42345 RepID=A0A8B8ZK40_PHODC|nr:uncharacterized protein LOC120104630 [Phoenix dactylifera]
MPRKQVVRPSKKRSNVPEATERRSKARNDVPPPRPHAPSPPRQVPLVTRRVSLGRKIDFDFLEAQGFTIGLKLKAMGWETLCSLDIPTYPNLVRHFYANLKTGIATIESVVKETPILLNPKTLGSLVNIPTSGSTEDFLENRVLGIQYLLGTENVSPLEQISANRLSVENRLLHHIVSRILFSKTGRFDFVSERDILVIFHILNGSPLSLPHLIIRHMVESASRARASLPYGMLLTLVFEEFGVNTEGEPSTTLGHWDTYNDRSLHRMGFRKKDGQWIRKDEGKSSACHREEQRPVENEESFHPPTEEPIAQTQQPTEVRLSAEQFRALRDDIVQELRNSRDVACTDLVPSNATVCELVAEMRAEMVSLRCLLQGQYQRFVDIEEETKKLQQSVKKDMENLNENAQDVCDKLLQSLHKINQTLADLNKSYLQSNSEVAAILQKVSEVLGLVMGRLPRASSSFTAP